MSEAQWGWHPLADRWAARIVDAAGVRSGELVLDLGAGDGALAHHLALAGARVIAVELHPRRCEALRSRFAGSSVKVVEADLRDFSLPRRPFRVVASPPYHLTTELIRRMLARDSRLLAADLVLQRGAARSFADGRGPAWWRRRWQLTEGMPLPRSAFIRPPTVDSRLLRIRRAGR